MASKSFEDRPAPKPVEDLLDESDTELVKVIHDGRVKLVRRCNLIDPQMTGE